jgi:hypothetical protein
VTNAERITELERELAEVRQELAEHRQAFQEVAMTATRYRWTSPVNPSATQRDFERVAPHLCGIADEVWREQMCASSEPFYWDGTNMAELRSWLEGRASAAVEPSTGSLWVVREGRSTAVYADRWLSRDHHNQLQSSPNTREKWESRHERY